MTIPKIIHQIWWQGIECVPKKYEKWAQTYKTLNPHFQYQFWHKERIMELIETHYTEYMNLFNSYKLMIQKIDVAKLFILHHYGGFYADYDTECLIALDDEMNDLTRYSLILSRMNIMNCMKQINRRIFKHGKHFINLNNAVMGCEEKHDFFKFCIKRLERYKTKKKKHSKDLTVLITAGPEFISQAYRDFEPKNKSILIAPPDFFDVYSGNYKKPEKAMPSTIIFHHSTGSWSSDMSQFLFRYCCVVVDYGIFIIPLLIILLIVLCVIIVCQNIGNKNI